METRIIDKMIKAMKLTNQDNVLLNFWGTKEELSDLKAFQDGFVKVGIETKTIELTDEGIMHLIEKNPNGLSDNWFDELSEVTVVVDIMNRPAGLPPVNLAKEKLPVFGKILSQLFEFMCNHEKMIQITMPSETNAKMEGVDFEEYQKTIIDALDIDYDELQSECEKKIGEFQSPKRVIRTGKDCVLEMDLTDRKWYVDAGDGSFPCGEIYIAPVEEKTNGTIYFENFVIENGDTYKDVILTFKDGKLVDSSCSEFMEFMKGIDEEDADVVAELGIGMNPNIKKSVGSSPLDEDILGTFHIALGMNHMFGGKNKCRFHMDFVTTGKIE